MRIVLLAIALTAIVGCKQQPEPLAEPPAGEQPTASTEPQGNGGGIGIVSPAAGGVSPVTNTDSVTGSGGGGSGIGTAAKQQAKGAAAKAGGSSLDQLGGED